MAARDRAYDSSACASCISREMEYVSAHSSASTPMCELPYGSQSPSWTTPSTIVALPIRAPKRAFGR